MAKIYTRTGDKGTSSLLGGTRLPKSHPRFHAYGTIDELNAQIGLIIFHLPIPAESSTKEILLRVQNELFIAGSLLACDEEKWLANLPQLSESQITALEKEIDHWNESLPALKNFILPGGTAAALQTHVARTICRRAERWTFDVQVEVAPPFDELYQRVGTYLNRLSDHLFTLSRYLNHRAGTNETPWIPS